MAQHLNALIRWHKFSTYADKEFAEIGRRLIALLVQYGGLRSGQDPVKRLANILTGGQANRKVHWLPYWKKGDSKLQFRTGCGRDLHKLQSDGESRKGRVTCQRCIRAFTKTQ